MYLQKVLKGAGAANKTIEKLKPDVDSYVLPNCYFFLKISPPELSFVSLQMTLYKDP